MCDACVLYMSVCLSVPLLPTEFPLCLSLTPSSSLSLFQATLTFLSLSLSRSSSSGGKLGCRPTTSLNSCYIFMRLALRQLIDFLISTLQTGSWSLAKDWNKGNSSQLVWNVNVNKDRKVATKEISDELDAMADDYNFWCGCFSMAARENELERLPSSTDIIMGWQRR